MGNGGEGGGLEPAKLHLYAGLVAHKGLLPFCLDTSHIVLVRVRVAALRLMHATLAALASVVKAPNSFLHAGARVRLAAINAVAEDVSLLLPSVVLPVLHFNRFRVDCDPGCFEQLSTLFWLNPVQPFSTFLYISACNQSKHITSRHVTSVLRVSASNAYEAGQKFEVVHKTRTPSLLLQV